MGRYEAENLGVSCVFELTLQKGGVMAFSGQGVGSGVGAERAPLEKWGVLILGVSQSHRPREGKKPKKPRLRGRVYHLQIW